MEEKKKELNNELSGSKSEGGNERSSLTIEDLQKKLEECEKTKAEYLAGWQRTRADFLNYKKEEIERIEEILKYGEEEFILRVLPILDSFEIAEKRILEDLKSEEDKSNENIKGLLLIKVQLQDFLKNQGVEEIKTVGEKFNPNFHEVVEEIEMKDKTAGTIAEEIQKGYKINGRLLRPAKVKVVK